MKLLLTTIPRTGLTTLPVCYIAHTPSGDAPPPPPPPPRRRPRCYHLGEPSGSHTTPIPVRLGSAGQHLFSRASGPNPLLQPRPAAASPVPLAAPSTGKAGDEDPLRILCSIEGATGGQYCPQATPRGNERGPIVSAVVGEHIPSPHEVNPVAPSAGVRDAVVHRRPLPGRRHQAAGNIHLPGSTLSTEAWGDGVVGLRPDNQGPSSGHPVYPWNAINPSLMASAVHSSTSSGTFCHLCQEVDHSASECALVALDLTAAHTSGGSQRRFTPQPARRSNRPHPYDSSVEVCRRFNRG